ncbi:CoA-binding protein [Parvibium lacunae]|uniref:CoA-binding protein n=1 Tax=Parvibium lacunae TaxID=1888893 RepID=A0A368L4J1_9BURK|nr:CoA-binding protein [Parvibium lacunae]RCS58435.1 CoA-binding protein [Parvibium lacunae]
MNPHAQPNTNFDRIFTQCRRIAVVGLSPNPARPSHYVSRYLQLQGYQLIPVNPGHRLLLGEVSYPELSAIPEALDWVLCFRRSEEMPALASVAIAKQARCFWMQVGIQHDTARSSCEQAGVWVVENRCAMVEHQRWQAGR